MLFRSGLAFCLVLLREKGGTQRWQPVSPTLMRHLVAHWDERGDGNRIGTGQLLRYRNGRPITYIACTKPRYPVSAGTHEKVQAMPHIRFRPIEAGHNCILSAPDLVATELLEVPR